MVKYLLALGLILPISFQWGGVGSHPIDFLPSDILVTLFTILSLVAAMVRRRATVTLTNKVRLLLSVVTIFISYICILGVVGTLLLSEIFPLVSALKFAKPYVLLVVVYLTAHILLLDQGAVKFLFLALISLPFLLLMSDIVLNETFPLSRWGGYLLEGKVYGFPNSAAAYYSLCLGILFIAWEQNMFKGRALRFLLFLSITIFSIIIPLTLSRTAVLGLIIVWLMFLWKGSVIQKLMSFAGAAIAAYWVMNSKTFTLLVYKMTEALTGEDRTSGRVDIHLDTIELISQKPVTGYLFEAYTNYSIYGTPHSQYLETLYKIGWLGFLLNSMIFLLIFHMALKSARVFTFKAMLYDRILATSIINMSILLLILSIAQPNISYGPTGNMFMIMAGVLMYRVSKVSRRVTM